MAIKVCVFDAYGTLFDVAAAARACAAEPGREALAERWTALAETWRRTQLSYTWLRAVTGDHVDFWTLTGESLDYALEVHGLDQTPGLRERLLQLYFELDAYPDATSCLSALKAQGLQTAILSNGEPRMLEAAVRSAGLTAALDAILSVESVGVFKPAPQVYDLVGARFDCAADEVAFVSSNGWDACSAAGYGFYAFWVNRRGEPIDRLAARPNEILETLDDLPARVAALSAG